MKEYIKLIFFFLVLFFSCLGISFAKSHNILIFPFNVQSNTDHSKLSSLLENSLHSNLSLVENFVIIKEAKNEQNKEKAFLIASEKNCDFFLLSNLSIIGSSFRISSIFYKTDEKKEIFFVDKITHNKEDLLISIQNIEQKIKGALFFPNNLQKQKENFILAEEIELPADFSKFSYGDFDGDKEKEFAFMSSKDIFICKKEKNTFKQIKEIKGKKYNNFIGIYSSDINKNGVDEIFINQISNFDSLMNSFVLEYQNGNFAKIFDNQNFHYKIINKKLFAQRANNKYPFSSKPSLLSWKDKKYLPEKKLENPKWINIYNFVFLDNEKKEIISFNNSNQLVFSKEKEIKAIKKNERFEKSLVYVDYHSQLDSEDKNRFYINHPIYILENNHKKEFVVINHKEEANGLFAKYKNYKEAWIEVFEIEKNIFKRKWKSQIISGYISDYALIKQNGQYEIFLLITDAEKTFFSNKKENKKMLVFKSL